jgi:hypothetical protein
VAVVVKAFMHWVKIGAGKQKVPRMLFAEFMRKKQLMGLPLRKKLADDCWPWVAA